MGALCCCQRQENFEYASPSNGSRCQQCCARRCCSCCFPCCGMFGAWFHPSEEHEAALSMSSTSPSQSAGLLGGTSTGTSAPVAFGVIPDVRYHLSQSDNLQQEKNGASPLPGGNSETVQRSNGLSMGGAIGTQRSKVSDYIEEKPDMKGSFYTVQQSKHGTVESFSSLMTEEDICPTCLEGYDPENPRIDTKCGHHFHLSCIFEWMERSNNCPMCDKEMVFNESP